VLCAVTFKMVLELSCPENRCWWTWYAPALRRQSGGNAVRVMYDLGTDSASCSQLCVAFIGRSAEAAVLTIATWGI
jgi:hypothetical protein